MGLHSDTLDFVSSQVDRPTRVCSSLPSHSRVGELFFLVGTTKKLYACFIANTWTEIGSAAGSGTPVFAEIPTGTIDGNNTTFTLAHTPVTGSLQLFLQGRLLVGGTDYTLATATLTMDAGSVPQGSDSFIAFYMY